VVELTIAMSEGYLTLRSSEPGFERKIELPQGVAILSIQPELAESDSGALRQFALYPGGAPPRLAVELGNTRKSRRIVRLDPIVGSARIERPEK